MVSNRSISEIVETRSGFRELRRWWECADPWAAVLIVHGAAEYSGRYERVGSRLSAAGISARAFDLQGCGGSGGRPADIDQWSTFLLQVRDNLAPLLATNLPVVLLGHSVGGLIAVDYTFSHHPQPDLVVLHAPAIGAVAPVWQRKIAPWLARFAPRLTFANPIRVEEVFSDPETVELYEADPLATTRTTVRLGATLLDRIDRVERSLDEYHARTLVLHGTADTLVLPSVSEAIGDLQSVDRKTYPGFRHGTIIERQGMPLIDDIITWVGEQIEEGERTQEQAPRRP